MLEYWRINIDPWHVPDEDSLLVEVRRDAHQITHINGCDRETCDAFGSTFLRVLEDPPPPLDCTLVRVG